MTYREVRTVHPDTFRRYPPALRIVCPLCKARPAQPCIGKNRVPRTTPHAARVDLAHRTMPTRRHRVKP